MRKLLIVLPTLNFGGAERVCVTLANHWASMGTRVKIIAVLRGEAMRKSLHQNVDFECLGRSRLSSAIFPLYKAIKSYRPCVCWVHMWPLTCLSVFAWVLTRRIGRLVLTEHAPLVYTVGRENQVSLRTLRLTVQISYPLASAISAVSEGVGIELEMLLKPRAANVFVVHNPLSQIWLQRGRETVRIRRRLKNPEKLEVLAVGSLKKVKNHALILEAFSRLKTQGVHLTILGEGPLREKLISQAQCLDISRRVTFATWQHEPSYYFARSNLLVVASEYEGFCNVVIEALAFGVPVLSTDCPYGPRDILKSRHYGSLIPPCNADELAKSMDELMAVSFDPEYAVKRAWDFRVEKIARDYERIFVNG